MARPLARVGAPLLAILALLSVGAALTLRASLPRLEGRESFAALAAPVSIERDARGSPSVHAHSREDLAFATGYLHAEDRYFEMDLSRRLAAGELAELLGPAALGEDLHTRAFRLRSVARAVVAEAPPAERAVLLAYTRGVNAGLAALGSRPWEYWFLRSRPAPWLEEDSVLTALALWWQLQHGELERATQRAAVRRAIVALGSKDPEAAMRFLYARGTSWDAPVTGPDGPPAAPLDPPVPPPEALDLRLRPAPVGTELLGREPPATVAAAPVVGSNNWALSGAHTADGRALVANDMHLELGVPAVWYPMRLIVAAEGDEPGLDAGGVTLPGVPALIAGSNGAIAWGFTNSYGDWLDVTRMSCPGGGVLLRPDGQREAFQRTLETIRVRGGAPVPLVIEEAPSGLRLPGAARPAGPAGTPGPAAEGCDIVAWLARVPAATNFGLLRLERARSVEEALELAPAIGIPAENLVVGDASGHVGWTVIGRIPDDRGAPAFRRNTGTLPWRDAGTVPRLQDPAEGLLWTANARVIDGAGERIVSGAEADSGVAYDLGARARQIRDDLRAVATPAAPAQMLAIALDDRARFLARWQRHLLELLDEPAIAGHFERAEFRRLISDWSGRAEPGSVSYRLVSSFHAALSDRAWRLILWGLDARDGAGQPLGGAPPPQFEGTLWQLVTQQPAHLLPLSATSWRAFELEALDAALDELARHCRTLASCGYESNRPIEIRHPFSAALPGFLAEELDMPPVRLPGDRDMPRVQVGSFGASVRFAVEPGREEAGYLELPGGASGHPLSPFYRAGFADWAAGRPAPFRPGPVRYTLELMPAKPGPAKAAATR
jgi:penicillin amidase